MEGLLGSGENPNDVASIFQPLELHKKGLKASSYCYRVYKNSDEFVEVEAKSAYDAMLASEVKSPFKIVRYTIEDRVAIPSDMLTDCADNNDEVDKDIANIGCADAEEGDNNSTTSSDSNTAEEDTAATADAEDDSTK